MDISSPTVVGLLHPGEMGAAVGGCLTRSGHTVLWASDGRSQQTAARAAEAGLTDAGSAATIAARADIILSICPPHAALDVAWAVQGFGGLYLDANAISPGTAREVASLISGGGGRYVDGGIIGSPPASPGDARLYLSGEHAATVRDLFAGTPLDARIVEGGATAASAVKMAYAAWTKGTAALLLAVRALARAEGVEGSLLGEWDLSQPALANRSVKSAESATAKGWRWVAEMEEIAATMAAAGLPDGFHQAAAEVFRRSPRAEPGTQPDRAVNSVLAALTGDGARRGSTAPA
jgi:3-hydroxyisobutyrate dehydrogenase-like beta-hydroxyacid dehydrogenase